MHINVTELLGKAALAIHEGAALKPGESKQAGEVHISDRDTHLDITFTVRRDAKKAPTETHGPSSTSKGQ